MFGWNRKKKARTGEATPDNNARIVDEELKRIHNETLGHVWHAISGMDPARLMPLILKSVLEDGGTRPPWQWQSHGKDFIAMAWPADQPLRACVLLSGKHSGKLQPIAIIPLLEGTPNDFAISETFPHTEGGGANVAVTVIKNENPMWFFDPFYTRDEADLTPDVTQTFWLGAVALGVRPALTEEIVADSGPEYDAHAQKWLEEHPGAKKSDVPPLKINPAGRRYIQPGRFYGEYRVRSGISQIQDFQLANMPIRVLYMYFPIIGREPLRLPVYVSQYVLQDLALKEGDEIEAYIWLQGRIIDLEAPATEVPA